MNFLIRLRRTCSLNSALAAKGDLFLSQVKSRPAC